MIRATISLLSAHCPHCKSIDFRSVDARNAIERAAYRLLRPYRCELCGQHFLLLRWLAPIQTTA